MRRSWQWPSSLAERQGLGRCSHLLPALRDHLAARVELADLFARLDLHECTIGGERMVNAVAVNVLIGGTDAHAKDYSLVLVGPRTQMAPLYDVASAACYPQHQRLSSPIKIGNYWQMLDVTG